MGKGDFSKIQSKITKPDCESCGQNSWDVVEEINGEEPSIPLTDPSGNVRIPAPAIRVVLTVCQNCGLTRTYAVKQASGGGS